MKNPDGGGEEGEDLDWLFPNKEDEIDLHKLFTNLFILILLGVPAGLFSQSFYYKYKNREIPFEKGQCSSYFRYGAVNIPLDEMRNVNGGEDAWMASNNFLVISDGLGKWWEHFQIDAGQFSKRLVAQAKQKHDNNPLRSMKDILKDIKRDLYHKRIRGSATALMAKFDVESPNVLKTLNLGDSGYMLIRPK